MQNPQIKGGFDIDKYDEGAIFQSQEHFQKEIACLCHGDLYVIGRIWIQALRTVLVGADLSLIPVVKAAPKEQAPPPKPPKMKYKDLPIYESPHYEYKDYVEDKKKCPNSNVKILHTYLFPKVTTWRKGWADAIKEFNTEAGELKDDACAFLCQKKTDFICYMRSGKNLVIRQAVLFTGIASGCYMGRGAGILKKIFFSTAGGLAAGALCFPKETDEIVREGSYIFGKFAVTLFNTACGRNLVLRERLPCRDDMPPPPPPRPADQKNKCEAVKKEESKKAPSKKEEKKKEPSKKEEKKKEASKKEASKKEIAT